MIVTLLQLRTEDPMAMSEGRCIAIAICQLKIIRRERERWS